MAKLINKGKRVNKKVKVAINDFAPQQKIILRVRSDERQNNYPKAPVA